MGLDVVGPLGRSGRVIVSDERADGTVILLICEEYDSGVGAVFVRPEEEPPPELPAPRGFPWPTEELSRLQAAAEVLPESVRRPFILRIDTSGLPPGPQAFRSDALLRRVFEAASDGVERVILDARNAREWGWVAGVEDALADSMT